MLNPKRTITILLLISSVFPFIAGCDNDAKTDALIGTGIGVGVAALAGGDSSDMLVGAAVGGGVGYVVGNESDKKKAQQH